MEWYRIYADDLDNEELDYELAIRACPLVGGQETRRRELRNLLRGPNSSRTLVVADHMMQADLEIVPYKLQEIERIMIDESSRGMLSRLVHYHQRVRRYVPHNPVELENRRRLLELVDDLARRYFQVDFRMMETPVPQDEIRDLPAANSPRFIMQPPDAIRPGDGEQVRSGSLMNPGRPNSTGSINLEGAVGGDIGSVSVNRQPALNNPEPAVVHPRPEGGAFHLWRTGGSQPQYTGAIPRAARPSAPDFVQSPPQMVSSVNFNLQNPQGPVRSIPNSYPAQEIIENHQQFRRQQQEVLSQPRSDQRPQGGDEVRQTPRITAENINMNEYVHCSQIEAYVKRCVEQITQQGTRYSIGQDNVVNNLADEVAQVRFADHEVQNSLPNRIIPPQSMNLREPSPPLQLSGSRPDARSTPRQNTANLHRTFAAEGDRFVPVQFGNILNPRPAVASPGIPRYQPDVDGYRGNLPPRRQPHQQCAIIEKWPKFTGDTNTVPVTDFLRQIDILCRSYDISKQELRMHAHLLFKDNAYVWYTTYEEKFNSWETLEVYLKMRYDNPNRDRLIREEMRNRKQRPNELFSAFLADMEMLAQRMIRKMSEAEKFEMIVENMKLSYKRRLALEPIQSIDHLAQMCYKFDALESNLYQVYNQSKSVHHVALEDEGNEDYLDASEAEVYALRSKMMQNRNRAPGKTASETKSSNEQKPSEMTCWNCNTAGHLWRDCDKRKRIFCHICGMMDTTAFKCPNQHNLRYEDEEPKNE